MSLHLVSPSGPAAPAVRSTSAPSRTPRKGASLRLVSTKDLEREDWLEVRRTGIGSSDAAAAIGLNPYQSQLERWMQKTGKGDLLPAVDPTDDTSPMFWGTLLDPIVAAHYTKRTGRKVRCVNAVLQHPEHPWIRAADVVVLVGGQELRIFRIERDEALIARLITLEKEFWDMVQSGTAPAGDGSDSAEQALRCLYPFDTGDQVDLSED